MTLREMSTEKILFVPGFCSGGMSLATPAFIAETSSVEIRGMLGYSFDIMCSFGELYM